MGGSAEAPKPKAAFGRQRRECASQLHACSESGQETLGRNLIT